MALTAAQCAQNALNTASALNDAVVNHKPIDDKTFKQQVCSCLMLLAEAVLAGGATSCTLEGGIANLSNVASSTSVSQKQR